MKLRGAAYPWAGRVELTYEHDWTTLCDDKWDLFAANAVCRTMGYGTANEASFAAKYGQGTQLVSFRIIPHNTVKCILFFNFA